MTADGEARHEAVWRADIDALLFRPAGHGGLCAVHRLAFRALLGLREPAAADCLAYAAAHRAALERAASAKIARRGYGAAASLHLTSRDVARALWSLSGAC